MEATTATQPPPPTQEVPPPPPLSSSLALPPPSDASLATVTQVTAATTAAVENESVSTTSLVDNGGYHESYHYNVSSSYLPDLLPAQAHHNHGNLNTMENLPVAVVIYFFFLKFPSFFCLYLLTQSRVFSRGFCKGFAS